MKTLLQALVGLALCAAIAYGLIYYSKIPLLWEHEEALDPGVYSLTWRSGVALIVLLAITQTISFVLFRRLGRGAAPEGGASNKTSNDQDMSTPSCY